MEKSIFKIVRPSNVAGLAFSLTCLCSCFDSPEEGGNNPQPEIPAKKVDPTPRS